MVTRSIDNWPACSRQLACRENLSNNQVLNEQQILLLLLLLIIIITMIIMMIIIILIIRIMMIIIIMIIIIILMNKHTSTNNDTTHTHNTMRGPAHRRGCRRAGPESVRRGLLRVFRAGPLLVLLVLLIIICQ